MYPAKKKARRKGQQLLSSYFTKSPAKCTKTEQNSPAIEATKQDVYVVNDPDSSDDFVPPTPLQSPPKWLKNHTVIGRKEHQCSSPLPSNDVKMRKPVLSLSKLNMGMDSSEKRHALSMPTKRKRNPFASQTSPKKKSSVLDIENYSSFKIKKDSGSSKDLHNFTSLKAKENKPLDVQDKCVGLVPTAVHVITGVTQERQNRHKKETCPGIEEKLAERRKLDSVARPNHIVTQSVMARAASDDVADEKTRTNIPETEEHVADAALDELTEFDLGDLSWNDRSFETTLCSNKEFGTSDPGQSSVKAVVLGSDSGETGCTERHVTDATQDKLTELDLGGLSWNDGSFETILCSSKKFGTLDPVRRSTRAEVIGSDSGETGRTEKLTDATHDKLTELDLGDLSWNDKSFETILCSSKEFGTLSPVRHSARGEVIGSHSGETGRSEEHVTDAALDELTEFDLDVFNWNDKSFETALCSNKEFGTSSPVRRSVRAVVVGSELGETGISSVHLRTLCHSEEDLTCHLRGSWRSQKIEIGDTLQLHAEFQGRSCVVDDTDGLIVTDPDHLISTTTVVGSMFCARKSVLSLKYKDVDGLSKEMLMGSIAHELFQWACQEKATEDSMRAMLDTLLQRSNILHDMYGVKLSDDDVRDFGTKLIPNVARWLTDYLTPSRASALKSCKDIRVTAVRDIEENYYCPRLGLKGKIDATTEVSIHQRNGPPEKKLMPLELKTGKHSFSFEHMGQVILYSLMMSERFDEDTSEGLLLYIRDGVDMKRVTSKHTDRCGLLQRRNDLSYHLGKQRRLEVDERNKIVRVPQDVLPPPINSDRFCPRCPLSTVCSIYQTVTSAESTEAPTMLPPFIKETTQHLSSSHIEYFTTWCSLLDLEVQHTAKHQDHFWVEDACKREEKGQCLSDMRLIDTERAASACIDNGQPSFRHCFQRQISATRQTPLTSAGLAVGDRVAVSDQHWTKTVAFGMGNIISITENEVTVRLDRSMFAYPRWQKATFRIDRIYSASVFSICFSNLAMLMSKDEKSVKLRSFVIDNAEPAFRKMLPKQWIVTCQKAVKPLNDVQRRAVVKFLLSDDYLLIKGMPGTGKTTTIAALVEALLLLRQSVLLTSYTHSAVDSVLLKLVKKGVPFVRLGALSRIHDCVKEYSADFQTRSLKTTKELETFYSNQPIVATTCLGLSHPAVYRRGTFDVCIVDEASQAIQPSCLGPLYFAKRFVLVGDPQQLPPVVQSQSARKLGMNISLFERMQTGHNTVTLSVQYRMNSEIMRLCNTLTYGGTLECHSEKVGSATLSLPEVSIFSELLPKDSWVMQTLSEELARSVVFICTDAIGASDDPDSLGSASNKGEALIVSQALHAFIKSGLEPAEVGVITPFRNQVKLLKEMLRSYKHVDISTVDQYQGREKAAILFSCVKSHGKEVTDTEILNDRRRLNVALSRAKHKLVLVGCRNTMQKYKPFKELLSCLRTDQFIFLTPEDENIYRDIIYAV